MKQKNVRKEINKERQMHRQRQEDLELTIEIEERPCSKFCL